MARVCVAQLNTAGPRSELARLGKAERSTARLAEIADQVAAIVLTQLEGSMHCRLVLRVTYHDRPVWEALAHDPADFAM